MPKNVASANTLPHMHAWQCQSACTSCLHASLVPVLFLHQLRPDHCSCWCSTLGSNSDGTTLHLPHAYAMRRAILIRVFMKARALAVGSPVAHFSRHRDVALRYRKHSQGESLMIRHRRPNAAAQVLRVSSSREYVTHGVLRSCCCACTAPPSCRYRSLC